MNVQSQLLMVRQRWWVVLLVTIVAMGTAGALTVRAQPRYASSVTFFVTTPSQQGVSAAYEGSLFLQQRVKSYADLLTSDRLAQSVAADPGLGLTADEVQKRITSQPKLDTVLLEATVTDTDQVRSLRLAEAVSASFVQLVQAMETPPGGKDALVKVEVISGPRVSPTPVSPQPLRNLGLGALLGLIAGVGLALLRGMSDTAVRDGATLARVTGAPLIGQIPYDKLTRSKPLIADEATNSPRAEAMRKLRTNLRFVDLHEPARVIAVTSAVPAEGKSTTACNLAIVLAEAGWRVLLVDADLRRPQVADYFGIDGSVGLTDSLVGEVDVADVVQAWRDTSLLVLPAGACPPNPSELLGSKGMADLLASLKELADIVIIDTAPLLAVTDGVVVAVQADGALLVTHQGRTSTNEVTAAAQALHRVDARLLGCALNMTKLGRDEAHQYHAYRAAAPGVRTDAEGARTAGATPTQPVGPRDAVTDVTQELSRIPR